MASNLKPQSFSGCLRKSILCCLVLILCTTCSLVSTLSESKSPQIKQVLGRRILSAEDREREDADQSKKKTTNTNLSSSKNKTILIKPTTATTNSTKSSNTGTSKTLVKKLNPTKSLNTTTTSSLSKTLVKKLNSTSKATNSTKLATKKSLDLPKLNTPKNKTQSSTTITKQAPTKPKTTNDKTQSTEKKITKPKKTQTSIKPDWVDNESDDEDFISEFRDLPLQFHQTLMPDLEKFSLNSKAYMTKANKEISEGFRPLVGKQYAPTIASVISCVFILLPLLLVSLIFNRFKSYFSLQKMLIFIQVYLSIYFFILSIAAIITGLEPLKLFYATSRSSYICLQVFQTLGYVLYLLLLLMNLVVVFSTETGLGSKILGLGQTIVGCAVGLHYYVAVFHRAVLDQPPKTNWKVHFIYATCFLVICMFARAERRKKAYSEDGGEEGKKN